MAGDEMYAGLNSQYRAGSVASGSAPAARVPEITGRIKMLESDIEMLRTCVIEMGDRLLPAMRPSLPEQSCSTGPAPIPPATAPLAEIVGSLSHRVQLIAQMIDEYKSRLEI